MLIINSYLKLSSLMCFETLIPYSYVLFSKGLHYNSHSLRKLKSFDAIFQLFDYFKIFFWISLSSIC